MARHLFGETITVTRLGAPTGDEDSQGNPIIGPDETITISDVAVAPTGSDETGDSPGIFVVTGYNLYYPFDSPPLLPTDRITIRDVEGWQVQGDTTASGWRNPFNGNTPGAVVHVGRAS